MTYEFNSAAGADGAFMEQFYPYTTSPAASTAATSGPSTTTIPTTMASQTNPQQSTVAWPVAFDYAGVASGLNSQPMHSPNDASASSPGDSPQSLSPGHLSPAASSPPQQQLLSPLQTSVGLSSQAMLTEWTLQQHTRHRQRQQLQQQQQLLQQQQQQQQHQQTSTDLQAFIQNPALMHFAPFAAASFPQNAIEYLPTTAATTSPLEASIQLDNSFTAMPPVTTAGVNPATTQAMQWGLGMANWQDFDATMVMPPTHGLPQQRMGSTSLSSSSPTGTCIEVHSLSSSGEIDWSTVDLFPRIDSLPQAANQQNQGVSIFNPSETLHLRTNSDSSQSDGNSLEFGSYEEVSFTTPFSPFSQDSDSCIDGAHAGHSHTHSHGHHHHSHHNHRPSQELVVSPAAVVGPLPIKAENTNTTTTVATTSGSRHSPSAGSGVGSTSSIASGSASSSSPPIRRSSGPRKSPISKPTKAVVRRTSSSKDAKGEKKVGRRRGPLLPEQRKQASEIRKLRACLRCKFLKKTCDKGEPCAGCQPSHARLWQVPCTRIDIKDVGMFMKDWKADYERHMDLGVSVFNVKGFSQKESLMWITHGYGFCLPVMVREVYVADDSCFEIDWVESHLNDQEPIDFGIRTERLDVGQEGISMEKLSAYLDRHIDGSFEYFIDDHFEGTPFITEILKTAHRYYVKQGSPVIRKALKLVLAYNLTMHITMVEQQGSEVPLEGQIDDEDSKYFGKVVAPVMINFQIKCAMADMWRELQKDVLGELSTLYSKVYTGDRLKNWPTIFMLAAILLVVWEEMQFDCHYRVPDASMVDKFCNDMESTPVGVIVGLFHAISQKLPAFTDWDTARHGQVLNNNEAVCDAMTEVRQHILKHESYLRTRPTGTEFDRYDFDCLSNKFLSKLVIRAN